MRPASTFPFVRTSFHALSHLQTTIHGPARCLGRSGELRYGSGQRVREADQKTAVPGVGRPGHRAGARRGPGISGRCEAGLGRQYDQRPPGHPVRGHRADRLRRGLQRRGRQTGRARRPHHVRHQLLRIRQARVQRLLCTGGQPDPLGSRPIHKVGMNTLGAHNEAMLDIYLKRHGLSKGEIGKVQPLVVPPVNIEQSLRQRQIQVGVLGDILRDKAVAGGGIRPLFTDFQLLGAFSAGTYVMTDRFLQQNPDTAKTFVTGVARAIEWARSTPREEVIARMTEVVKKRGRKEDARPLKYWKSFGVAETGGRITDKQLQLWIDWLAERGDIKRGKVKASDLYTNEYNDYRPGSTSPGPSAPSATTTRS
ncbi:putative ABC-type nitrate/sulfonate/bicarbonate transport protein [Streptomyces himastatinicus ATCC 53653]|uniref:Putative ABC-type nitrate/sulfonate/bicarbonate transport protein n=1 Tax=Streptomyces himastatinicus ATCC 53653 TaxID=457427 RepID=D9WKZ1_9ACTN|nr:putative ABC-type nitrate/sulfonate/bicarbonate transport protein [Streptomyces himastatinicus ATCC 53653]